MDHAVKLTINGETREFPMGITYKEVVKAYEKTSPAPVILVIAGGKICELHKKAERDGEVRLVTTKDSIGNKTYKPVSYTHLDVYKRQVTGCQE